MGELTVNDVDTYTKGRLPAADARTAELLKRSLAGARRYCGWFVTPVQADYTFHLDGPGTRDLMLPTMNMTGLSAVTEDSNALDITTLAWSRQGIIRKRTCHRWSCQLGAITVTATHGYLEDDAEDWRGAVLAACDLAVQNIGQQLQDYTVDDVVRKWFKSPQYAFDTATLDRYRLMGVA